MAKVLENWFLWTQYDMDVERYGYGMSNERWQKHITVDACFATELNLAFDEILRRKQDVEVDTVFSMFGLSSGYERSVYVPDGPSTGDPFLDHILAMKHKQEGHARIQKVPGDYVITSSVREIIFRDGYPFVKTHSGSVYFLDGEKQHKDYGYEVDCNIDDLLNKFFHDKKGSPNK